jgi:hypothetical protein
MKQFLPTFLSYSSFHSLCSILYLYSGITRFSLEDTATTR